MSITIVYETTYNCNILNVNVHNVMGSVMIM